MRAACHAHLIVLDFVTIIIFGKKKKLQSPSLHKFLQAPDHTSTEQRKTRAHIHAPSAIKTLYPSVRTI
jgi:hypothetical protein